MHLENTDEHTTCQMKPSQRNTRMHTPSKWIAEKHIISFFFVPSDYLESNTWCQSVTPGRAWVAELYFFTQGGPPTDWFPNCLGKMSLSSWFSLLVNVSSEITENPYTPKSESWAAFGTCVLVRHVDSARKRSTNKFPLRQGKNEWPLACPGAGEMKCELEVNALQMESRSMASILSVRSLSNVDICRMAWWRRGKDVANHASATTSEEYYRLKEFKRY